MAQRISGNEYRNTTICVDSYHNEVPTGTIYNPYYTEPRAFHSAIHLLRLMNDTFSEMNYPQAFSVMRTFSPSASAALDAVGVASGAIATFRVRILFRQNASWQGEVQWVEGHQSESFRSILELLYLMDSALQASR